MQTAVKNRQGGHFENEKTDRRIRLFEIVLEDLMIVILTILIARYYPKGTLIIPAGVLVFLLNTARIWFEKPMAHFLESLWKWRWIIALFVFIVLVLCQVHFSSAAAFSQFHSADPSVDASILFGTPRAFRTDEYNVQLPYFFSQAYNGYAEISHQMSVQGMDMILGYNAPVLNLTLIGKPLVWGYILFGNAYGVSWYFCAKILLMFMGSLEMFMILTRSRPVSLFGAFFLTFAPAMQWWLCPHFFDPMMWSILLFVIGYWFFRLQGWKKWGMSVLAVSALTGFVLGIFPSLQVPCGLLMLALLAAALWRDRKELTWKKSNIWNIVFVIFGVAVVLVPVLWSMKDDLKLLLNTEYPGSRASNGGNGRGNLWMPWINAYGYLQPFVEPDVLNNSEISSFSHFGIAFMLFYPWMWYWMRREKNPETVIGNVLFWALCIELFYLMVPIPMWLAKITLLSMVNRMQTVFGLTAAIATVWMARMVYVSDIPYKKTVSAVCCAVYGLLSVWGLKTLVFPAYLQLVPAWTFWVMPLALAFVFWLCFTRFRELFFAVMTGWTVVTGMLVNPVMTGAAAVEDYPIAEKAREIAGQEPEAWWLSLNSPVTQNLLLANGAKVLNATNFYPDFAKWQLLDPDLENKEIFNRYANITVRLRQDGQPSAFSNPAPDALLVELNPADLEKLNVSYLSGHETDAAALQAYGIDYDVLFEDQTTGDRIFALK